MVELKQTPSKDVSMKLLMRAILLGCLWAAATEAQDTTIRYDKKFSALAISMHGASVFDLWHTYGAYEACKEANEIETRPGYVDHFKPCFEGNLLARPLVHAGPVAAYVGLTVFQFGLGYVSGRMRASKNPILNKTWWAPYVVGTGIHIYAGINNQRSAKAFEAWNNRNR